MSGRTPQVTAVIVTYQSRQTIGPALEALQEAHVAGRAAVVVVDNASKDGTAGLVADHFPWVTLIDSGENMGFGRGCNTGFEKVTTPYVLFINPDATIQLRPLEVLLSFMDLNPVVGIVAPAILEGDGQSLQAAGLMATPASIIRSVVGTPEPYARRRLIRPGGEPFATDWVCGAAMLVRSSLFRSVGGFDPRFFLYFEETDLCRRVTDAGAEIWTVGEAVVHHVGGASAKETGERTQSNCISEHYYRSRFYYLVKHFGWVRAVLTECFVAGIDGTRTLRDWCFGRGARTVRFPRPFLRYPAEPLGDHP